MASIVQTITLAPAFMQEIKEDDRRLKQLLSDFRRLVARWPLTQPERLQLASLVSDVRDRVAFHFALEEAYGYFEDPVAVAPRLCDRVDSLCAEHGELFADICCILDVFEESESGLPADFLGVQEMCRGFLYRFDAHEAAENALIVQAFNEDIGVGD
jgi:Hemerythrin HHE cation binding domain